MTPPGPHAMTAQAGAVAAWISEYNIGVLREYAADGYSAHVKICNARNLTNTIPLYLTPPAAVPVEALEGLAAEWEAEAAALLGKSKRAANLVAAGDLNTRAAQLRKLIKERSNG